MWWPPASVHPGLALALALAHAGDALQRSRLACRVGSQGGRGEPRACKHGVPHLLPGQGGGGARAAADWGGQAAAAGKAAGHACTCAGWAADAVVKLPGRLRPALTGRPAWRSMASKPWHACCLMSVQHLAA